MNTMSITNAKLNNIVADVMSIDMQQVNTLVDAIKLRRNRNATQSIRSIEVGSTVKFVGRKGVVVTGTVLKKKIKNCVVDTGVNRWNVPASMLEVV